MAFITATRARLTLAISCLCLGFQTRVTISAFRPFFCDRTINSQPHVARTCNTIISFSTYWRFYTVVEMYVQFTSKTVGRNFNHDLERRPETEATWRNSYFPQNTFQGLSIQTSMHVQITFVCLHFTFHSIDATSATSISNFEFQANVVQSPHSSSSASAYTLQRVRQISAMSTLQTVWPNQSTANLPRFPSSKRIIRRHICKWAFR